MASVKPFRKFAIVSKTSDKVVVVPNLVYGRPSDWKYPAAKFDIVELDSGSPVGIGWLRRGDSFVSPEQIEDERREAQAQAKRAAAARAKKAAA